MLECQGDMWTDEAQRLLERQDFPKELNIEASRSSEALIPELLRAPGRERLPRPARHITSTTVPSLSRGDL